MGAAGLVSTIACCPAAAVWGMDVARSRAGVEPTGVCLSGSAVGLGARSRRALLFSPVPASEEESQGWALHVKLGLLLKMVDGSSSASWDERTAKTCSQDHLPLCLAEGALGMSMGMAAGNDQLVLEAEQRGARCQL